MHHHKANTTPNSKCATLSPKPKAPSAFEPLESPDPDLLCLKLRKQLEIGVYGLAALFLGGMGRVGLRVYDVQKFGALQTLQGVGVWRR